MYNIQTPTDKATTRRTNFNEMNGLLSQPRYQDFSQITKQFYTKLERLSQQTHDDFTVNAVQQILTKMLEHDTHNDSDVLKLEMYQIALAELLS